MVFTASEKIGLKVIFVGVQVKIQYLINRLGKVRLGFVLI
jgi:hypothetical protein